MIGNLIKSELKVYREIGLTWFQVKCLTFAGLTKTHDPINILAELFPGLWKGPVQGSGSELYNKAL